MRDTRYYETECKSALNRVEGMPFRWSLNPYRGCVHECRYCYARSTHRYFELGVGRDFAGTIFVKTNVHDVLARELSRRSWRREEIALGTATDPYQPIEGRYRLTRRCLEVATRYRTPISIVTKGPMVLRDLDVLQDLAAGPGATVCFSIPTVDRDTWRRSEPGTAPPHQRLRAMQRLTEGGVRAGVMMAPLLPGISATRESIEATVRAAADHGAQFIGSAVLHLNTDVREYFLSFIGEEYPQLLDGYRRLYGQKYAPEAYREKVTSCVRENRLAVGCSGERHRAHSQPPEPVQQPLPIYVEAPRPAAMPH